MDFVLTDRFCQDPVGEFFGKQWQLGRVSDNPDVNQFGYNSNAIRIESSISCQSGNTRGRKDRKRSRVHVTDAFRNCHVEIFHKHHGSVVIYWPQGHQHRTSTSCQEGTCDTAHTLTLQDSASSTVKSNFTPQDKLEQLPLVHGTFSTCNPFFEGTLKSIQGLKTKQFLQWARFRRQQCEFNQLTTSVSSLQLLLPVSLLGFQCWELMQSFIHPLEHMVSLVLVSSTGLSTDFGQKAPLSSCDSLRGHLRSIDNL